MAWRGFTIIMLLTNHRAKSCVHEVWLGSLAETIYICLISL